MEIRFDATSAEQLLRQMDSYCTGIQKETKDLLTIVNNNGRWNDNQTKAFQANILDLAKNLNQALTLESDYMRTFYQRIRELRGQ